MDNFSVLWRVLEAKPMTYMTIITSGKFHTSTQKMQKTRCFLQKIAELTNCDKSHLCLVPCPGVTYCT